MKNDLSLSGTILLCLGIFLIACHKSNGGSPANLNPSSLSFSANDSMISFPVNLVFIQDVSNVQTTLITGQYADSSSRPGNISIRVLGDTTGRFHGDSLFVSY